MLGRPRRERFFYWRPLAAECSGSPWGELALKASEGGGMEASEYCEMIDSSNRCALSPLSRCSRGRASHLWIISLFPVTFRPSASFVLLNDSEKGSPWGELALKASEGGGMEASEYCEMIDSSNRYALSPLSRCSRGRASRLWIISFLSSTFHQSASYVPCPDCGRKYKKAALYELCAATFTILTIVTIEIIYRDAATTCF